MMGRITHRPLTQACTITLIAVLHSPSVKAVCVDECSQVEAVDRDVDVEVLLEQLRTDPERNAGESFADWFDRISLKNLDIADKLLAHPVATTQHRAEAAERKLAALDRLAGSDPEHYEERWRSFARRVIEMHPGSPQARDASYLLLGREISDHPADPEIASRIERFVQTYPGSGGHAYQLYFRLTGLLYERDPDRALGILDRAIPSLPPDSAEALRQYKSKLTMIGSKLTMSWPKLDGQPFTMEELRGKVVFVYSWATWCAGCIEKFPMLNELHAKYRPRGFEIVAVSLDEEPSVVLDFLKERDLPWIHVMHSEDFRERYGFMGTPGSILINRDGVVVDRALFSREEIESAVERLLESPSH